MERRIGKRQRPGENTSSFTIRNSVATIDIRVHSRLCIRGRRTIAIAFFRQLKPFLRWFKDGTVLHWDDSGTDIDRFEERGIFIPKSTALSSGLDELGVELKLIRLQKEWSQAELATRSGLCLDQISRIERGLVIPHPSTIEKLSRALGVLLEYRVRGQKVELAQGAKIKPENSGESEND